MNVLDNTLIVAARDSALSKVQVEEVYQQLKFHHPRVQFAPIWMKTWGDIDQTSSLMDKEKTDFFTKEIDEFLLQGHAHIAIHSAKDLPDPLTKGLVVVAYTKGVDPSDVLVFREGETLSSLPSCAKVGTSSLRRKQNLLSLRKDLCPVEIRGTIEKRLARLDAHEMDALIMAKAALLRLKIIRPMEVLPGPIAPLQGKLAVVAREGDDTMRRVFSILDVPLRLG